MALRPRWQQKMRTSLIIVAAMVLIMGLLALPIFGYLLSWKWTGFLTKTLWDWMQLLIVPVVLAIGGFWLNYIQKSREERSTEMRNRAEQDIAADNQSAAALQAYIDTMSELLFEKGLRESHPEDEVRIIARARTLSVLRGLDAERKGSLLQFLYEARLINKDVGEGSSILNLEGADLSEINLCGVTMHNAHLSKTNLYRARLSHASLRDIDLSDADLNDADLSYADLSHAYLRYTNLMTAHLYETDLLGANLRNANLRHANLRYANLDEADLSYADLDAADLSQATVVTAQLNEAKSLRGATLPDGSTHS